MAAAADADAADGEWQEWRNPQDYGPPSRPPAPLGPLAATGAGWVSQQGGGGGGGWDGEEGGVRNAVIVLNTDCVGPLLRRFWDQAHVRVCADGGANRLFDAAGGKPEGGVGAWVPHYIKGDLDSLRPEVGRHFEKLGTRVLRDPDQDTNDLEKCLELIRCGESAGGAARGPTPGSAATNVFVVGSLGLRFDHAMAAVHILHKYGGVFRRLVLLGPESTAFLLPAGRHRIHVDPTLEGPICGLLPLAGPCRAVTTRGLRWDLAGQGMAFGGLVSTSNEVAAAVVEVEASDPLVWTTTLRSEWRNRTVAVDFGS
jgi:thiamine pyrophosphokinase